MCVIYAYLGEGEVDEISKELATGDEEAIGTDKGTSDFGGRSFGDVERGGHGGHADAKADKDTADNEERWPGRGGHDDGADEEEEVGDEDGGPAAESIVHPTTNCRPYNGPCHRHAHDGLLFTQSLNPFRFKIKPNLPAKFKLVGRRV